MPTKSMFLEIKLLSYWHAGSGFGRGADVDALVLKDPHNLPYLPGRTVKGLLREAMMCCEESGAVPAGVVERLFGKAAKEGKYTGSIPGILAFDNAVLPGKEREWLSSASSDARRARSALYDSFASTSLDKDGIAQDRTLRTIELCVPVALYAEIHGIPRDDETEIHLSKACSLLRAIGSHRTRGLGRCDCTLGVCPESTGGKRSERHV